MHIGDIVIHIDENLDDKHLHDLQHAISHEKGVYSACNHERTRHLMVVDFDPEAVRPSSIIHSVRARGLNAQMIGL
jgi:hypothetical protein